MNNIIFKDYIPNKFLSLIQNVRQYTRGLTAHDRQTEMLCEKMAVHWRSKGRFRNSFESKGYSD